jgi:hypothetical protein
MKESGTLDGVSSGFESDADTDGEEGEGEGTTTPTARVTFADEDQIKLMTPLHTQSTFPSSPPSPHSSPNTPDSGTSTPNSIDSLASSPIAKTLATRLSFWSRLSKRTTSAESESAKDEDPAERISLDSLFPSKNPTPTPNPNPRLTSPSEILSTILATTAPPPPTADERKSELEDKIVRETVKEFTKGGMYFAYNFGMCAFYLTWPDAQFRDARYYEVFTA